MRFSSLPRAAQVVVVAVGSLLGSAVVTWGGYRWASPPDRTELAQWLMGATSLLTVLAASLAAYFAYRAFELELERERDRDQQARRAHASQVAAWAGDSLGRPLLAYGNRDQVLGDIEVTGVDSVKYAMRNASHLPVTDVKITIVVTLVSATDDRRLRFEMGERRHPVLAPVDGPDEFLLENHIEYASAFGWGRNVESVIELEMEFTDSSGVRWRRSHDGRLAEVPFTHG